MTEYDKYIGPRTEGPKHTQAAPALISHVNWHAGRECLWKGNVKVNEV